MSRSPTRYAMLRIAVILATALLLASGCGEEGDSAAESSPATLSAELRYVRDGGFVGDHDVLVIRPDGHAKVTRLRGRDASFELSRQETAKIARAVAGAKLDELDPKSTSAKPVPDAFVYTVSYRGRKVETDDAAMPDSLAPLRQQLDLLVTKHTK
jgi:Emfourin